MICFLKNYIESYLLNIILDFEWESVNFYYVKLLWFGNLFIILVNIFYFNLYRIYYFEVGSFYNKIKILKYVELTYDLRI